MGRTINRLKRDVNAAPMAGLTDVRESFNETLAHTLSGHLYEPERRYFSDLMLRTITAQALYKSAKYLLPVGFQNHVNEVDDNNSAEVAQAKLPSNFFSGFNVVLCYRLLEIATFTSEFTGINIHHDHGFGAIDDKRTT